MHFYFFASLNRILLLLANVNSTPDGNLRFFVEHWHSAQDTVGDAGTMDIKEIITGSSPDEQDVLADGVINGKNIYDPSQATGWGCRNDETPEIVRTCHDFEDLYDTDKNDW